MKKMLLLFSVLLTLPFAAFAEEGHPDAHMAFEKTPLHAHLFWESGPIAGEEAVLRIEFKNSKNHNPTEPPGGVTVTVWQSNDKKVPFPATVQHVSNKDGKLTEGVFRASKIKFMSTDPWELGITLKYPNQQTETVTTVVHPRAK